MSPPAARMPGRSGAPALTTTDGFVAYSGILVGNDQAPDFTPVAYFPGLTPEVRARLNDMKVAPGASRHGGKQRGNFRGDPHAPAGGDHCAEACAHA